MPLGKRNSFGGFNKRRGMMGNRHNQMNPRNRQRELQRRRERERRRRERDRRRREQQNRRRKENLAKRQKKKQKQQILNKHTNRSSNPLDKLKSNFNNFSLGKSFKNNKTRNEKLKEKRNLHNRPADIYKRGKNQHLDDNHYKHKGKEFRESAIKEINRDPSMKKLSNSEKDTLINSKVNKKMKEYKQSVKSQGLKTNREAFIGDTKAKIKREIDNDPALRKLSKEDKKKYAQKRLKQSVSNYDKQAKQRAAVTKQDQIDSKLKESDKRRKERVAEQKLEKLKHQESIPVSKRQERKWKERGLNQKSIDKEIAAIEKKKGVNRLVPKSVREKQVKELKAKKQIEGKKQNLSTLKMNREKDRVLHQEKISDLSASRKKSVNHFKELKEKPNVSTHEIVNAEKRAIRDEVKYRQQVYSSKRNEMEYKEKMKLARSEKKLAQLETGKTQIENKRFISPTNKKLQLTKMNQTIAREKRKLRLNEYTHSVNNRAFSYKETLHTSKLELKHTKLKYKESSLSLKKKYKDQINKATSPEEKRRLKSEYESRIYDLREKGKKELSDKRLEVKNARHNLEKINKEYKQKRQEINLKGRKEEIYAQLENLQASYKQLNRPRIFSQKPNDLLQQNIQQQKALQNELSRIDKHFEKNKSVKSESEFRGLTPLEEKQVVQQSIRKNNPKQNVSAPAQDQREQEMRKLQQEEMKLKREADEIRKRNNEEKVQKAREEQLKQYEEQQRQNEEYRKQWEQYNQQAEELKEKYRQDTEEYAKVKSNLDTKYRLEQEEQAIFAKGELSEEDMARLAQIQSEKSLIG